MNLKAIFEDIACLLGGLYFIETGIKLFKNRESIILSHTSDRESGLLLYIICWGINIIFIDNNSSYYFPGFITVMTCLTAFIVYIIYSRINDVKYRVYNARLSDYEKAIKKTFDESAMEFSSSGEFIEIKDSKMFIEFIPGGFLIKHCKKLKNYKDFLERLEYNLKNSDIEKKKRDWITSIVLGIFLLGVSILWFNLVYRFF